MRIRRRPPQIPAPASSDSAAGGGSSAGGGVGESATTGVAVGKGEIVMGTEALHPSIEASGKGRRPWGGDSVSWGSGQPGGGGSGGSRTCSGADDSCYGEVLQPKEEEEDGAPGANEKSEEKRKKHGAALPKVDAHKTWNHIGAGGGLHSVDVTANGLGAELVSVTGAANGCRGALAGAARKRKDMAWSSHSSTLAKPLSSLPVSVKAGISNGGGITSYMHGNDHQLVKDEEDNKGEQKQQQQQLVNGVGNNTGNTNNSSSSKRRRSPVVLMEGSRCSRVNGRGWRCCQQTLVGYSLCEHHLGKGRLRSVSSVRCKKASGAGGKKPPKKSVSAEQEPHQKQQQGLERVSVDDDEDWEPKPAMAARRGKRIGVVKARSISSLLIQTSQDVIDHAGGIQEAGASKLVPATTSAGLLVAVVTHVESSTLATAAAAAAAVSRLPDAHQVGISPVM